MAKTINLNLLVERPEPAQKTISLTVERASAKPTVVLTNKHVEQMQRRAAAGDLEAFLKRYIDLRRHLPELESMFEKMEEAVRRLRAKRPKRMDSSR